MKKSDLKIGQKLVARNGMEYIYFPARDYSLIEIGGGFDELETWDDGLCDCLFNNGSYDIMEVFECKDGSFARIFENVENVKWTSIWKRENVEEITADEAMKRLEEQSGKKIKIIR